MIPGPDDPVERIPLRTAVPASSPTADTGGPDSFRGVWYGLALLFGLVPPLQSLAEYLLAPGALVQDDARQFLFWMARWHDSALFSGDLIADYFRRATPLGFAGLYRVLDFLGIDPWLANRLIPVVLGPLAAHFAFRLVFALAPSRAAAFAGSALTSFFAWLMDDMASATPRAFALPLLLAFLACLAVRRPLGTGIVAVLAGLFYPQAALVVGGVAISGLIALGPGFRIGIVRDRGVLRATLAGIAGTAVGLLPFVFSMGGGAKLTAAEALALPAFQPGGRSAFFLDRADWFYLCGERSGLLPAEWGCHSFYGLGSTLAPGLAGVLLVLAFGPALVLLWRAMRKTDRAAAEAFTLTLPVRVLAVGVTLYAAAHVLLFALHLPGRYGQLSLRAVTWVSLTAVVGPSGVRYLAGRVGSRGRRIVQATACGLALLLVPFPFVPRSELVPIDHPGLYGALTELPVDTVIATLAPEADTIPSRAERPVFIAREYLIPYSKTYGETLRKRTEALIGAVYAVDPVALREFAATNGIGAFVLDAGTYSLTYLNSVWWRHDFPEAWQRARDRVAGGGPFALTPVAETCAAVRTLPLFRIIPVSCLSGN